MFINQQSRGENLKNREDDKKSEKGKGTCNYKFVIIYYYLIWLLESVKCFYSLDNLYNKK